MPYRSVDPAIQERLEALEAEISAFDREIAERSAELAAITARTTSLRARFEREGPGGGTIGASMLRIPLLANTFLGVGVLLLPLQYFLACLLSRPYSGRAVWFYLVVCAPTFVGTVIATSFRAVHPRRFLVAIALSALVVLLVVFGRAGAFR